MDDFLLRAFFAGLGVAVVAGPLGTFVVWRKMAYFGAMLAHSALLGVALGFLFDVHIIIGVIAVSLAAALILTLFERQRRLAADTLLGIMAHGALALGLVTLAFMENVRLDLMAYLFGDILAVTRGDLVLIYGAAAAALAVLAAIWRPLLAATVHAELAQVEGVAVERTRLVFLLLLALVVALAMKIVGLLLIASLLIIPAATARPFARTPEGMAVLAAVFGVLAVAGGLYGSFAWDTPSGPSIVVAATLLFALSALGSLRRPSGGP